MRAWLAAILCSVACSSNPEGDPTEPSLEPLPDEALTLRREGEIELRGTQWSGVERLRLVEDDLFEPVDACVVTYTVTGTVPRTDCEDCNTSPEGDGGAHEFETSAATIEAQAYAGACDIVLGAMDASSLDDLNGRTLVYGWGEEATGHGYSLFTVDSSGDWFDLALMDNPFENVGGVLDERQVDAFLAYFVFEGSYAG